MTGCQQEELNVGEMKSIVCSFFVNFWFPGKLQFALLTRLESSSAEFLYSSVAIIGIQVSPTLPVHNVYIV